MLRSGTTALWRVCTACTACIYRRLCTCITKRARKGNSHFCAERWINNMQPLWSSVELNRERGDKNMRKADLYKSKYRTHTFLTSNPDVFLCSPLNNSLHYVLSVSRKSHLFTCSRWTGGSLSPLLLAVLLSDRETNRILPESVLFFYFPQTEQSSLQKCEEFFSTWFSHLSSCLDDNLPADVTANVENRTWQFHHQLAECD